MPGFFYRHFLCCAVFCCDVTQLHVHTLHEKHFVTQLCFLFRTVYAPFGSLQMCQHRTGNTALATLQSFEEEVLQGFHKRKDQIPRQQPVCCLWCGMVWYVWYCPSSTCLSVISSPRWVLWWEALMFHCSSPVIPIPLLMTTEHFPFTGSTALMWQGFGSRRLQG